jgi:hypothetical protein
LETVIGPLYMLNKEAVLKSKSVDKQAIRQIKEILC